MGYGGLCRPSLTGLVISRKSSPYTNPAYVVMSPNLMCRRRILLDSLLLLSLKRLPSNELTMTQGLIANMLGARPKGEIL